MSDSARGNHVSPGIYTKEVDLSYASKSLGITTLGLVGETVKGPAFQPILIEDMTAFRKYFGDLSPVKFSGSQYPKYELPYIAKSYLTKSRQLYVVRVLGFSGYNAGPAWAITASKSGDTANTKYVVAILRSRGKYDKYTAVSGTTDECGNVVYKYDGLQYFVTGTVKLDPYTTVSTLYNCGTQSGSTTGDFKINTNNYGQFNITCSDVSGATHIYPVSLNPGAKDYITNVLGTSQDGGNSVLYVDELYDVALEQMVNAGTADSINSAVTSYGQSIITPVTTPVLDVMAIPESALTRNNVGQTYLAGASAVSGKITFTPYDSSALSPIALSTGTTSIQIAGTAVSVSGSTATGKAYGNVQVGHIYTVASYTNDGEKHYCYREYTDGNSTNYPLYLTVGGTSSNRYTTGGTAISLNNTGNVYVLNSSKYYAKISGATADVKDIGCDMNDYKETFRHAMTPWFVSSLMGDGKNLHVYRLFRFHTISDGNASNSQVKISIMNIKPNEGTFDVLVRDYNDTDAGQNVLERYRNCTLVPGTKNYLGLKIGTENGSYPSISKYVTVEIVENDTTAQAIPAGFLGYPIRSYGALQVNGNKEANINSPIFVYNTYYDEDVKDKRQFFGMSDITGVDLDVLSYKGRNAYTVDPDYMTRGFHLDARLNDAKISGLTGTIYVDDETNYKFDTTSLNSVTSENKIPIFGTEEEMQGTIYENVNTRKFTAFPYGGFDGWDVYRAERSNTDDFKTSKYKGAVSNVNNQSDNFSKNYDSTAFGLSGSPINSDYYAYLAGAMCFSNPAAVDINIFATPGIDYVNNEMLSSEILDMIEERKDSLYIMTTPDKPSGNDDTLESMYSASEAADNLSSSEIDTSYAATYYPWVKYYDGENSMYINLPPTKDVVRNLADTDNTAYPWYAPAGVVRGNVDAYKAHSMLKLDDEDDLINGRINPIKTFANEGPKVWGDLTMLSQDTPVNRIHVRRLIIRIQKLIAIAATKLIFDPDDSTVASQFDSLVRPILNDIEDKRGLYDFKMTEDTSAEARDQHELPVSIMLKPTADLEYIPITFTVTPSGVNFDDIA